jgi:PAS domain S-box-containing protein
VEEPGSPKEAVESVEKILAQYEADFHLLNALPEEGDLYDPIRRRLNSVSALARGYRERSASYQGRVETLLQVLLRYALFDFSVKAEVSEAGDEIDAIALGLNTVADELQAARDTERRQMEVIRDKSEQVEVILSNAPSAVVVIGADDKVVRWNERATQMFGYKPEEAVGLSIATLIIPERYIKSHRRGLMHYLETGEGPLLNTMVEVAAKHKNGKEFPVELGISAVKSAGQELFVGFLNDISMRREAEERLRDINFELENSNRELESFSYSVSHDLRAPLRAINGYTQILMKEYTDILDDRGKQMMNSVLSNVKKMGVLIDDLLALSRFGRAELKKQKVDMERLFQNAANELRRNNDRAGIEVKIGSLPHAMADPTLISQAVTNLVSNAVKYSSKSEKPKVEIGATKKDGETVYFVRDNGTGFDMKFYGKLFGVFQRLHDSSEFEGTGVGLAIVKRIIDRHEGHIWADSELGKGATFYFTLGKKQSTK